MSQDHNGNDDGAPMDYREHERTFAAFLTMTKWGAASVAAVLIAMAFGFFAGGGFFGGLIVFVILMVVAWFFL
ncbi:MULTISPECIES: aa3-type cytochrome c oxidase subunit IV [unclassified Roseitalea]|uniref:aa3-type cytochrome c oxidase subunit IV n=1 Tax=unclassified Roseitalea TaxID=2639107 RepID=UPI00273FDDC4|nr:MULTISPECIES: aa3-type cytochrome c oxidase subunit IV [unclassified Roseitalea]